MAAVSKSLTKDDLGCVVEALTPVKHKWEVIGLQIGVRSHVLEAIKLEHSRNPGPCLLAVLKEHLSKIDPQPCWEGFVKALRSESVGETAFAEALLLKFCPNEPLSDVQSPECSTSDEVTSPVSTSASEQNQFPFLKLPAEMSKDARETLYGRLSTEHREMQWKFQRLVTTTRKGLAKKGVTPEQLSDEICCQSYESQFDKDSKKLLSDSQEEIRKSKSINDAFFLMRNHYSFFNYELIEKIITIFNLDRSHLLAFEDELRRFCERRVHEFPAKAYGTAMSSDSKLSIVLDSEFDKYTMNSLRSFRHRLGKIFKVSSAVIRLIEVFEGSIEIIFAISSSLVDQILPLSEEQEKSLRDEGVKRFEFKHPPNSFMAKPKGPVPTTPADLGEQLAETTATRDDSGTACIDQKERTTSEKHSVQVQLEEVTAKAEQLQAELNVTKSNCYELQRKNEEMGKLHLKVQLGDVSAKSELLEAELAEWKARCAKIEDDRTRMSEELKLAEARVKDLLETIDLKFTGRVQSEEEIADMLKQNIASLQDQFGKKEHEMAVVAKDAMDLKAKLQHTTEKLESASNELNKLQTEQESLKVDLQIKWQELEKEQYISEFKDDTIRELKHELITMRTEAISRNEQTIVLKGRLIVNYEELERLKKALHEAEQQKPAKPTVQQQLLDATQPSQLRVKLATEEEGRQLWRQLQMDYITAQQNKSDIMREKEQLKLELEHLTKWMQQAGFSVDPETGALPVPRQPHPPATDSVAMLPSRANQGSGPGRQQQYPPNYPPRDPYQQGPQIPDQTQLPSQPHQAKSKYVTTQQDSLENPLVAGIDTDICIDNVAAESEEGYESWSPPDVNPNLVCPMCGLQFRIGEIQKYRGHVQNCKGSSSSDSSHPAAESPPLADSHRQSDCHSKHPDSGFMSGKHSREYSSPHKHPDSGFMSGMRSQNVSAEVDSRTHKSTK